MHTVSLRSSTTTLPVLHVDDLDADGVERLHACLAAAAQSLVPSQAGVIGQHHSGPILEVHPQMPAVLVETLRQAGFDFDKGRGNFAVGDAEGSVTFEGLSVVDDQGVATFPFRSVVCDTCGLPQRFEMEFKGSVPRAPDGKWCKGAGCASTLGSPTQGPSLPTENAVEVAPGKFDNQIGRASTAQTDAEIESISARLAEHPDPTEERAAILESMGTEGPASTAAQHDALPGNEWTEERTALHDDIIAGYIDRPEARYDREVVLIGGPPGAGKGSALAHKDGFHRGKKIGDEKFDEDGFMHIDPDAIKQELLDRPGAVRRVPGMTDGEHAALLHAESSHIAARLTIEARARGMNVVLDKTMASSPARDVAGFRGAGYSVRGVFVSVPVDESKKSATKRWVDGGRYVPISYIEQSRRPNGSTKNFENFQSARGLMDEWMVIDNTGISERKPRAVITERGTGLGQFAINSGTVVFKTDVPRDGFGRWTHGGGTSQANVTANADIVINGDRITVSPAAAVPLIEDLGNRPGSSDLTKVTIDGHPNLYGTVANNELRRHDMPQIPSDRLDDFAGYLGERGITTKLDVVDPADLKATQNELDGRKVGKMIGSIRSGRMSTDDKPLWVSSDGFILDGHHRWAAEAAMSVGEQPRRMQVVRASVPMATLLQQARAFNFEAGIESKRHGLSISDRIALTGRPVSFVIDEFGVADVPRDANGRWVKGAGGSSVVKPPVPENYADMSPGQKAAYTKRQQKLAAESTAASEYQSDMPGPAELDKMQKTGGPLGSNGGGWYKDENGQKYLVKPAPSREHADNELAAQILYRQLGVPVDDTSVFERDGQAFIVKRAIQNEDGTLGNIVGKNGMTPDLQMQARQGFGADALASSWDAYGMTGDNVLTQGGTLHRIDVGGAGMFRAQGGSKDSFAPGKRWVEPSTLRSSNQGRKLYGDMSDQDARAQLSQLSTFDVGRFDSTLRAQGVSDSVRTRMVDTVSYRINVELPRILNELG